MCVFKVSASFLCSIPYEYFQCKCASMLASSSKLSNEICHCFGFSFRFSNFCSFFVAEVSQVSNESTTIYISNRRYNRSIYINGNSMLCNFGARIKCKITHRLRTCCSEINKVNTSQHREKRHGNLMNVWAYSNHCLHLPTNLHRK